MRGILLILALCATGPAAAQPSGPADALKIEVAKERMAHLSYDADLVSLLSKDFTSIDAGQVSRPTRMESRARFKRYFDAVVFRAWDDIAPPQITISNDGTMATVIVTKLVRLVDRAKSNDPGAPVSETRFAWLETWRREGAEWKLLQVASTRAPGS